MSTPATRIRKLTDRSRLLVPVDQVVREVNGFLRGWAGYFRYGNSARQFDKISTFAVARLALFLAKRHKRSRSWGWRLVAYQAPDRLGLISLTGTVAAPRPIWGWRARAGTRWPWAAGCPGRRWLPPGAGRRRVPTSPASPRPRTRSRCARRGRSG